MSHKNSLLFIGGVDKGHTPTNGETMKNQLYLDRFEEFFDIIHVIDTHNWKHRPWVFLQIPLYVLSFPHAKIFLSINRGLSLCRLLYYIGQSKRTYCSVVGGNLLEVLEKKQNYLPSIQNLRGIFVQGRKMAETLKNQYRIPNAVYVPKLEIKVFQGLNCSFPADPHVDQKMRRLGAHIDAVAAASAGKTADSKFQICFVSLFCSVSVTHYNIFSFFFNHKITFKLT